MCSRTCHPSRLTLFCLSVLLCLASLSAPAPATHAQDRPSIIEPLTSLGGAFSDIAVLNGLAYAIQGAQLLVLDVADPSQVTQLGATTLPDLQPATAVKVVGPFAYVLSAFDGLTIVDVSDPQRPRVRGTYTERTLFEPSRTAGDIVVRDNLAYLAINGTGLRVLDLSDPDRPLALGSGGDLRWQAMAVEVMGDHAYLLASQELVVFDIANPRQPARLGSVPFENATDLELEGDYAYVSTVKLGVNGRVTVPGEVALHTIDVRDPQAPVPVGVERYSAISGRGALRVAEGWIYLDLEADTALLSFQNPAAPAPQGRLPGLLARGEIAAGRAYTVSDNLVQILTLRNPAPPEAAGSFAGLGGFRCVLAAGPVVYLVQGSSTLLIVDIADPARPRVLHTLNDLQASQLCEAKVVGNRAFSDHAIFDLSDRLQPRFLASFGLGSSIYDTVVVGDTLYAAGQAGLQIFDLRDPLQPALLSTVPLTQAMAVTVADRYVYVGGEILSVVDAGEPTAPRVVGRSGRLSPARQVLATESYVLGWGSSGFLFDVRNPQRPLRVGVWSQPDPFQARLADGLFFQLWPGGLQVMDMRVPARSQWLSSWAFHGESPASFDIQGGLIYVASRTGLLIYQIRTDQIPPRPEPVPPPSEIFLPTVWR